MSTGAQPDERRRWLTAPVGAIGAASFFSDLGHEVATALLPSLLRTLGAPAAVLGLIEGLSDGAMGFAKLFGGALADDPKRRRRTAIGGYVSTALLSSLIGAATAAWQVGFLRLGAWIGRGVRGPSRNALLADATPPEAYGRAYGFERAMDNLGAIGGPLLALALLATIGLRDAILVSVIPGLLAAVAIVFAVGHLKRSTGRRQERIRLQWRPVVWGELGRFLVAVSAFELGNLAATLLILRATELLEPGRGAARATEIAVLLYVCYNAAATGTSLGAGRLGDRRGPVFVFVLGVVAFLGAYLAFGLTDATVMVLLLGFVLAGAGIGCVETAEHTAVARLAHEDVRGSAFGVLAAIQSFGNLAASCIAGLLWTLVSPGAAFAWAGAWMVASLAALTVLRLSSGGGVGVSPSTS